MILHLLFFLVLLLLHLLRSFLLLSLFYLSFFILLLLLYLLRSFLLLSLFYLSFSILLLHLLHSFLLFSLFYYHSPSSSCSCTSSAPSYSSSRSSFSPSSGPLHHLHTPTAGEAVSESVSESFGKVFPYFKAKKETVWPGLRHALKTDHHIRRFCLSLFLLSLVFCCVPLPPSSISLVPNISSYLLTILYSLSVYIVSFLSVCIFYF